MRLTNILKQKIIRKIKISNEFMEFSQKAVASINTALTHRRLDPLLEELAEKSAYQHRRPPKIRVSKVGVCR